MADQTYNRVSDQAEQLLASGEPGPMDAPPGIPAEESEYLAADPIVAQAVASAAEVGEGGFAAEPDAPPPMEMRQVAGLTSGSVMPLDFGAFQFSESIENQTFSVRVGEDANVVIVPGTARSLVDDTDIIEPTPLPEDGVLNVGSACFQVRPPRRPLSPLIRAQNIEAMLKAPGPIAVPEFEAGIGISQPGRGRGIVDAPILRGNDDEPLLLTPDEWAFLGNVRSARLAIAERHRQLHPNPEELKSRLSLLEPGLWERSPSHAMFGRFSVAYANIPWEPRFDDPDKIPVSLHDAIFDMDVLPWVPVTANLLNGPLGIVGSRTASLACARHAMLSLAALTAAGELEFSIVTAKANVDAWSWTAALPRSFFPSGDGRYTVVLADGLEYFDSAGLDHQEVKDNELGLIVVANTVEELPSYCGTVLQLDINGTCQVTNHLGETVPGTPVGVTEAFAHDMATRIADVLEAEG